MRDNTNQLFRFKRWPALVLTLLLFGCAGEHAEQHDYQIVINGSATPEPVKYSASYSCQENGQEVVRDISGDGSSSFSFRCEKLNRVRLQRILGTGLVSLSVYADGVVVFETPPTDLPTPLLYVAPR